MPETITTLTILKRLEQKVHAIRNAIETKNVDRLRDECACSLICGDETIITEVPVLDEALCFKYKGYDCELSSCNSIANTTQIMGLNDRADIRKRFPQGIFTDRYICWIYGHKDDEGKTLEKYLEEFPNETEQDNNWAPNIYLVPKAWAYGAEFDLNPGHTVNEIILEGIDKFLEEHKGI